TIYERERGPEHLQTAEVLYRLAKDCSAQGKLEQAEPLFQQVLTIYERERGPEHLQTAEVLYNLARNYSHQRKYEQAEPLFERALVIYDRTIGLEHPKVDKILRDYASLPRGAEQKIRAAELDTVTKKTQAEQPEENQNESNLNGLPPKEEALIAYM